MSTAAAKTIMGASSEVVRGINRRLVLNLIRTCQPLSRADLARQSGLQRSTVSLIVEDLIAEDWVIEGPTGRLPRGRRPTFLRLNEDRVILSVDLRPTQITTAMADVNGKFTSQEIFPPAADPQTAVAEMIVRLQHIIRSAKGKKIEGIGITLPGRFDSDTNRIVFAPNLKWADFDLAGPIAEATGLEVVMENAANACVLAAAWFHNKDAAKNLVVITVSEGIGAGLFVNGVLARGYRGMAGEFGHVPLDRNGPLCGCGSRGCWEVFASNRAALRYYSEGTAHVSGMNFADLLSLAGQGDSKAIKALNRMAGYLGQGMRMIVAGLAPERIIVIGDLTRMWDRFGPIIEAEVRAQVLPGGIAPRIIPAHEDGMARLRGTVALVLQKHFGAGE
jgi:predicted NBD/HSP70 family sugar kinase